MGQFNSETGYGVVFPSWLQHWVQKQKMKELVLHGT